MDEEGPGWHESGDDVPWWLSLLVGIGAALVTWLVVILILELSRSGA